jgi:hypothetical protein
MIWVPHFEDGRENAHEAAVRCRYGLGAGRTWLAHIWMFGAVSSMGPSGGISGHARRFILC